MNCNELKSILTNEPKAFMSQMSNQLNKAIVAGLGLLALAQTAQAQTFKYSTSKTDLLLGFRKTGSAAEANEAVVNIGSISNYLSAVAGSSFSVTAFTPSQLTNGTFLNLNNLNWSVVGSSGLASTTSSGFPKHTLWVTVPRTDVNIQSGVPIRSSVSSQSGVTTPIATIANNAIQISLALGTSNQFNTTTFVRENIATYGAVPGTLSTKMSGLVAGSSTLGDSWNQGNLEITTPASFTSAVRSDLYEVQPTTDLAGNTVVDPHTGTNSNAYFIGYFTLNPNGTMTFTRASATSAPSAPTLSISRFGNTTSISFTSANSATYTLCYTNASSLTAPLASWATKLSTLSGNGGVQTFSDITTDYDRVYSVKAQ